MTLAIIFGIIGFIAGAVLIYKLMQQKLDEQKQDYLQQIRQMREDLEKNHESRLKETIQSLQTEHGNQLKELETTYESRIQETIKNSNQKQETQLTEDNSLLTGEQDRENIEFNLTTELEAEKSPVLSLAELSDDAATITPAEEVPDSPSVDLSDDAVTPTLAETVVLVQEQVTASSPEITESTIAVTNIIFKEPEITAQKVTVSSKISGTNNQHLAETIVTWAKTGEGRYITQLIELVYHPGGDIRAQVALALGEIAASKNISTDIQKVIPVLGKLMQDSETLVRQSAVEALGKIKSEKVIPLLQKALRDTDSKVVKSANDGLSKAKFYRLNKEVKSGQTRSQQIRR